MEVPELLEVPLPGALVLPLLVEPEVVPVVLLSGALVLPLVVPAVLLVVPDDLFDVPLLTGAVSPSALLEENPSPATGTPRAFHIQDGDVAECRITGPDGFEMTPLVNPVVDLKKHPEKEA